MIGFVSWDSLQHLLGPRTAVDDVDCIAVTAPCSCTGYAIETVRYVLLVATGLAANTFEVFCILQAACFAWGLRGILLELCPG